MRLHLLAHLQGLLAAVYGGVRYLLRGHEQAFAPSSSSTTITMMMKIMRLDLFGFVVIMRVGLRVVIIIMLPLIVHYRALFSSVIMMMVMVMMMVVVDARVVMLLLIIVRCCFCLLLFFFLLCVHIALMRIARLMMMLIRHLCATRSLMSGRVWIVCLLTMQCLLMLMLIPFILMVCRAPLLLAVMVLVSMVMRRRRRRRSFPWHATVRTLRSVNHLTRPWREGARVGHKPDQILSATRWKNTKSPICKS